ncbi:DnaD domain-containing protein [Paenibacillus sp. Marseille-Q4541]|uniref:DnaD domain-containing protein n=1 Tax=Paenibacillus sp. Marseille-Q4541 TaxID=2831522 RepID=UPI001BAA2C34|nr:DnaD domain-containing protein [Paenibacillus sp. Marseille-Q4541]
MGEPGEGAWAKGVAYGMAMGSVQLPYALLRYYTRLGLSDGEFLLLQHLIAYQQLEGNEFPTLEELASRMNIAPEQVARGLQRLMRDGFVSIDEDMDEARGIQYERYNVLGLYVKLAECLKEDSSSLIFGRNSAEPYQHNSIPAMEEVEEKNMFRVFEKEFGRPLSPMEYETISGWMDQDRYPEELILLALKEAVFAGKVHFRYIDRILLEWSRNRVKTTEDVKAYTARFRSGGR